MGEGMPPAEQYDCPRCDELFYSTIDLHHHATKVHSGELAQIHFREEGPHQWVANEGGYRYLVRRVDSSYEIIIRESINEDPTAVDWEAALRVINHFRKYKRIANSWGN